MSDDQTVYVIGSGRTTAKQREVYFVRARTLGIIKIGVADNAEKRMRELAMTSPDALEALGCLICRRYGATEKELHQRFDGQRLHGEWFRSSAELLWYIECYASTNWRRLRRLQDALDAPRKNRGRKPGSRLIKDEAGTPRVKLIPKLSEAADA